MTPETLAQIHAAAFHDARPWTAAEFADLLANPHVFLCAAPHAFALGRAVAGEAELLTLATDPEHQRRGEAGQCLAEYHAEAAARRATLAFLEVDSENAAAITLYAAHGYAETARRVGYYAHSDGSYTDAIIMSRDLPYS